MFNEMSTDITSGQLNFTCCYQYRAFEHYLLPTAQWARQREALLEQAGLSKASRDFATVQTTLQEQLQAQFAATNAHLSGADNPHAHRTPAGRYRLTTPRLPAEQPRLPAHLFPRHRVVPLREVLTSVARLTQFDTAFGSLPSKHARTLPPLSQLLAALVGLRRNLGLRRLAQVAPQVDEAALQRLASTHFSLDNLRQANELILNFTRQLRLREAFRFSPDVLHSSSDGQKYDLAVDSLGGSASFKYFGNRRGLTTYSYVDETLLVFDSTVFSAADREATHLLDGLLRHAVRPTDVHSTATHGYTEVIFAVPRMLGIAYEPRIRQLTNQQLYSWEPVATLSPFAVFSYRHLNLHGEYDFSDQLLPAEAPFDMNLITAWQPPNKPA